MPWLSQHSYKPPSRIDFIPSPKRADLALSPGHLGLGSGRLETLMSSDTHLCALRGTVDAPRGRVKTSSVQEDA